MTLPWLRRYAAAGIAALAVASPLRAASLPSDAELQRMLTVRVDSQKLATGVVVGIVGPGSRRIVSYGVMGLDDKRPVDGDTEFGIGSLTKVFTALVLSDMARHGQVHLDDPAGRYLPVTLPDFAGRPITLADLASHTSGFPIRPTNLTSDWAKQDEMGAMVQTQYQEYQGYTLADLYRFVSSFKLTRAPGTHYEYSNVSYALLGIAESTRAGKPYGDLVQGTITGPLGMADTRMRLTPAQQAHLARGYTSFYGQLDAVPLEPMGPMDAAGAYFSTVKDLSRFLAATLGLVPSDLKPAMDGMLDVRHPGGMTPSGPPAGTDQIALAWNVHTDGDHEVVWKNGSVSGYRAFMGYDPKRHIGVVALANAQSGAGVDDIGLHLLDPDLPVDLSIPKFYKEVPLDAASLDRYAGTYRFSPTDSITVVRQGSHLYLVEPGQPKIELFAYGPQDFFLKVADAQVSFGEVKDGHAMQALWRQGGQDSPGKRAD
ncbi:MAG TPA: serine hydrolase [Gammaproteobacteria bacterium]|jgi:CubicO group peptidase (beta-lactamase class C family)